MIDLVPLYALDALEGSEMREFEAHLETCQQCRAELAIAPFSSSRLDRGRARPRTSLGPSRSRRLQFPTVSTGRGNVGKKGGAGPAPQMDRGGGRRCRAASRSVGGFPGR